MPDYLTKEIDMGVDMYFNPPKGESRDEVRKRTLKECLEAVADVEDRITADGWVKAKIQAALGDVRKQIRELE